jgi:hypothetical protein
MLANIRRVVRKFEKNGWVDVQRDPKDKRVKLFKWNNSAPEQLSRNYSPEAVAKMALPRLKGKPITEDVIGDAILEILNENQVPMTDKEIEKSFKSLKTNNKIIPITDDLIKEYKLIKLKQSTLSKSQRDAVHVRVKFLIGRGVISNQQLA